MEIALLTALLTSSRDSRVLIVFFRLIIEHSMQFVLMTTLIINALTAHCEVENIFVDAAFFLKAISIKVTYECLCRKKLHKVTRTKR